MKIGVCESQPITIKGLQALIAEHSEMEFCGRATELSGAAEMAGNGRADILILDKNFGIQAILDWLSSSARSGENPKVVIWGTSLTESESLRFLQAGARGILRKTADVDAICGCLAAVASGNTWMDETVFSERPRPERAGHSELTTREVQVLRLVEQGLKNREIGRELGIRPGTVKIHLKHIFEKTGVRGRYGLALNGLKQRSDVSELEVEELLVRT